MSRVVMHQKRTEEPLQQDALAMHHPDPGGPHHTVRKLWEVWLQGQPVATEQLTLYTREVPPWQGPPASKGKSTAVFQGQPGVDKH